MSTGFTELDTLTGADRLNFLSERAEAVDSLQAASTTGDISADPIETVFFSIRCS